jgi:predicted transcriptional regulator
MVAPNYAKTRSELAKSMGPGQQRKKSAQPKAAAVAAKVPAPAPKKAGRKKSA